MHFFTRLRLHIIFFIYILPSHEVRTTATTAAAAGTTARARCSWNPYSRETFIKYHNIAHHGATGGTNAHKRARAYTQARTHTQYICIYFLLAVMRWRVRMVSACRMHDDQTGGTVNDQIGNLHQFLMASVRTRSTRMAAAVATQRTRTQTH